MLFRMDARPAIAGVLAAPALVVWPVLCQSDLRPAIDTAQVAHVQRALLVLFQMAARPVTAGQQGALALAA